MSETHGFNLTLEQVQDFEFRVKFDGPGVADLMLDEPAPLGRGAGPNAARLIGAAVANCLTSSLLFCLRKFKQSPGTLRAEVRGEIVRNDRGRMRIGRFDVTINIDESQVVDATLGKIRMAHVRGTSTLRPGTRPSVGGPDKVDLPGIHEGALLLN